jgi:hypothetical protein
MTLKHAKILHRGHSTRIAMRARENIRRIGPELCKRAQSLFFLERTMVTWRHYSPARRQ